MECGQHVAAPATTGLTATRYAAPTSGVVAAESTVAVTFLAATLRGAETFFAGAAALRPRPPLPERLPPGQPFSWLLSSSPPFWPRHASPQPSSQAPPLRQRPSSLHRLQSGISSDPRRRESRAARVPGPTTSRPFSDPRISAQRDARPCAELLLPPSSASPQAYDRAVWRQSLRCQRQSVRAYASVHGFWSGPPTTAFRQSPRPASGVMQFSSGLRRR
ncbi:hypothetical protein C7412_14621 [Paraburkholderia silvatlantica]|nr:hypothetical protein C7412_14621 [Paraburkholderia silvatlantica]